MHSQNAPTMKGHFNACSWSNQALLLSSCGNRLRSWLNFQEEFSTLDPCAGDGVALVQLLRKVPARRYGIEIETYRAEQARTLAIGLCRQTRWTCDVRRTRSPCYTSILPAIGKPAPEQTKTRSCLSGPHPSRIESLLRRPFPAQAIAIVGPQPAIMFIALLLRFARHAVVTSQTRFISAFPARRLFA
jgi:hypothetical protein